MICLFDLFDFVEMEGVCLYYRFRDCASPNIFLLGRPFPPSKVNALFDSYPLLWTGLPLLVPLGYVFFFDRKIAKA